MQKPSGDLRLAAIFWPVLVSLIGGGLILWVYSPVQFHFFWGSDDSYFLRPFGEKAVRKAESRFYRDFSAARTPPTATNLSGAWSTGTLLVGMNVFLTQKGNLLQGRIATYNCAGMPKFMDLEGEIHGTSVTLTASGAPYWAGVHRLRLESEEGFPVLKEDLTGRAPNDVPYAIGDLIPEALLAKQLDEMAEKNKPR